MHFEENQLSPGLISLSPLSTSHPSSFHPTTVPASTIFYYRFTVLMDRSPGFGSNTNDSFALFRLGFPTAPQLNYLTLPLTLTPWTIKQKVRHQIRRSSDRLQAYGFRFYFTLLSEYFSTFPHGTGTLSVVCEYLALEDGPPRFNQNFSCSDLLRNAIQLVNISCTGASPSMPQLPNYFHYVFKSVIMRPTTPPILLLMVQAAPRSLATTCGISFDFFSFGYLDVSVHRVSFIQLCIHYIIYSLKL